ncbi:hypothetical protein D3C85_1579240 [compost metagenome]
MGAPGADIGDFPSADLDHAAPGNSQRPHIQRTQIRLVPAYLGILDHDFPVLDDGNIHAGASDFEEDAIRNLLVHECSGHPCCEA